MKTYKSSNYNVVLAGLIGLSAIVALLGSASTAFAQTTATAGGRIRIVHASPDAPAVDVYVDGKKAFSDAAFKTITDYAEVKAGSHVLQVVPTGKSLAQGPVVISATATVEAGKDYSVLAVGKLASIAPLILADDNTIPQDGKAHVRFVHASPDSPPVDVVVAASNTKLFSSVGFKSVGKYAPVDVGTYTLAVKLAGTDTNALTIKGLKFDSKTVYTIYAFGLTNGTPALSAGLSTDAIAIVQTPVLPVTGGEALPVGNIAAASLGALLIVVSVALRRRFAR